MSKRANDLDDGERPPKRTRSDRSDQPPVVEEIDSARQLQQLLTFRQDSTQQLRHGIASFKSFLDIILYREKSDSIARQLAILQEFLDSQKPEDVMDTERPFLSQLWQAWSFASQNNDDALVSAISTVLALLLKTLSGILDLRELGLLLCRTVLQHQHLRLVKRSLDAPVHKEFLISPCIRLLTEVTSFDGGVLAREVYKRREYTFEVWMLRRNLNIVKTDITEEEARRRPSTRTHTIRYILAHLKYLHEGGKIDLLKSRPLCTALFSRLRDDPSDVVIELLTVAEQNVLKDSDLPRSAKAALLVQQNLERVTDVATRSPDDHAAAGKSYDWLKAAATIPSYGVLRVAGWYPAGTTDLDQDFQSSETIDLGLDSIEFYDRTDRPDVRNPILLGWTQYLRPQSNERERELILACFRSAPELVAPYFAEKNMQLEPKLTNTWIGYASFLFEIMSLPLPDYLGGENAWASLPPQSYVMIENVLPLPLNQKVLARCLNQSSELVTFFAVRILVVAFDKLSKILALLQKRAETTERHASLWHKAKEKLLSRFIERCPKMKDVVSSFRKIVDDNEHALQREAVTRLLLLYYEVLPHQALEEQFDISAALNVALTRSASPNETKEVIEIRKLELEHMVQIAQRGYGMRWFNKQGSSEFSPLTTLLRLHSQDAQNSRIRGLIGHVMTENNILANSTSALTALVASIVDPPDGSIQKDLFEFLDDCFARATRKPVKYLDDLEDLANTFLPDQDINRSSQPSSLLIAVLLEQGSFVLYKKAKVEIMRWVELFLELYLCSDSSCRTIVQQVRRRLSNLSEWQSALISSGEVETRLSSVQLPSSRIDFQEDGLPAQRGNKTLIPFVAPPQESQDHPELFKWTKKDLDIAIDDGDVNSLILCLCSQYRDIRAQALGQLNKLEERLRHSNMEDKDGIYVLVGELIETYEHQYLPKGEALPYIAGAFATHTLPVQIDPTHFMYPKVNRYLNKGPEWQVAKLPNYWMTNTFLSQPEEDDAFWNEVQWVLGWLVDGLRTPADLEILRRCGVPERIMSLYASPGLSGHKAAWEITFEFIWRCSVVEGGSTTLITRAGVLSWLEMVDAERNGLGNLIKTRILETCDRDKIESWSGRKLHEL